MRAWPLIVGLLAPLSQEERPVQFEDCTEAVLAGTEAWAEQLARGPDHWAARVQRDLGVDLGGNHGLALGDVDGDGLDDLYVCQPAGLPNRLLLRNPDGTVRDVSERARVDLADPTTSALLIDLDGDGDQDLAVQTDPSLLIYENREFGGERRFGLRFEQRTFGYGLAAADHDLDGDLDLYVCGTVSPWEPGGAPAPGAWSGRPNRLLQNDVSGEGWAFVDVAREVGLGHWSRGCSRAALWEDWDDDGDPDLYLSNDFGPDALYRNDGGVFVEVLLERSPGADLTAGACAADLDGDGRLDLFADGALLRNVGEGAEAPFADVTAAFGLDPGGRALGGLFADLTNDGRPDLVLPRGFVSAGGDGGRALAVWSEHQHCLVSEGAPPSELAFETLAEELRGGAPLFGAERHAVFVNGDGERLENASAGSGLDLFDDGRAAARVDWDLDGWLDLWLANRSGPRVRFLRNRGPRGPVDGGFVALLLQGTACNRDAIGARVTVELPDGRRLARGLRAGEGHLAQSSKWLHFGLADAAAIERVTVRWPGGAEEGFEGTVPGGRHVLVQGSGNARAWEAPPGAEVALAASLPAAPPDDLDVRVVLTARVPLPGIAAEGPDGAPIALAGARKLPLLIVLFGPESGASLELLRDLADLAPELERLGIEVLALGLGEPAEAASALARLAWPHLSGRPTADCVEVLGEVRRAQVQLHGALQLPTSFLLDTSGRVASFYVGGVAREFVNADADRLNDSPELNRAAALAFGGRWHAPPPRPDLERLAARLARSGLDDAAREMRALAYADRELTWASMDTEVGLVRLRQGHLEDAIEHLAKAAAADPAWFTPQRHLGAALLRQESLADAAAALELALCLRPGDVGTLRDLALAYAGLDEREEAHELLEWLLILEPAVGAELAERLREIESEQ